MKKDRGAPPLIPVSGFHGVREALFHKRMRIRELWVQHGKTSPRAREILGLARDQGIPVFSKPAGEITRLLPDVTHQGIVALSEGFAYSDLDELLGIALRAGEKGLLVAADHITDEGNLGALIRTAGFFGAHGLIIPKDRSAGVTAKVLKRSSGTLASLPVARIVNMGRGLDRLKAEGLWIIGTSGEGPESVYAFDWKRPLVLVLGNEQKGLTRTIKERCHQVVRIPIQGPVESLNVAVAAGAILSEIIRQRGCP